MGVKDHTRTAHLRVFLISPSLSQPARRRLCLLEIYIYILLRKSRNSLQIAAASRAVHGACLRRAAPDCVSVKHIPGRLAPRRATRALIVSHLR